MQRRDCPRPCLGDTPRRRASLQTKLWWVRFLHPLLVGCVWRHLRRDCSVPGRPCGVSQSSTRGSQTGRFGAPGPCRRQVSSPAHPMTVSSETGTRLAWDQETRGSIPRTPTGAPPDLGDETSGVSQRSRRLPDTQKPLAEGTSGLCAEEERSPTRGLGAGKWSRTTNHRFTRAVLYRVELPLPGGGAIRRGVPASPRWGGAPDSEARTGFSPVLSILAHERISRKGNQRGSSYHFVGRSPGSSSGGG